MRNLVASRSQRVSPGSKGHADAGFVLITQMTGFLVDVHDGGFVAVVVSFNDREGPRLAAAMVSGPKRRIKVPCGSEHERIQGEVARCWESSGERMTARG
jgi:hypothetical protein